MDYIIYYISYVIKIHNIASLLLAGKSSFGLTIMATAMLVSKPTAGQGKKQKWMVKGSDMHSYN